MVEKEVYTTSDRALWLWEDSMNTFQPRNEKISIHEPLLVDPDHPEVIFERDILQRRQLAERILSRLRDDDCPRALGIYGGWGTGKTSLLNLMKKLNEDATDGVPSKLCIVSIDAWEHESGEGLLVPVVVALDEIKGNDVKPEMAVVVRRALFASGLFIADALLKKYANLELEKMQKAVADASAHDAGINHETILEKWKTDAKEIRETKGAFAALVNSACKHTDKDNIVICIDNLDRCSPENVVRLLESVKVFFNVPGCTWVFAMDSEVIASYISHKYEGTKVDGNSYLDKIIPEQYHLSLSPSIDGKNIADLLQYAANGSILKLDERNIPQLPRILVPRRLIKSAAKFAEFKRLQANSETRTPESLVFNLALLYHVWPDFYQRFSSASEAHIRGILDNFFPVETPAQAKLESASAVNANLLPLLKDYAEDQDLLYFLKTVFSEYQRSKNAFVHEVINGISGLRKVGLP
jgi:hypothetical protein